MKLPALKCAVYTRKSTDKGLEQDFNTLDAQRESCLAYITSQKSEGWIAEKTHYDDGGYSGGNLGRPALQKLLEDIKTKKINIVVVYKIDRLTRSLTDFAKLVEIFDAHGVSFVSVTQSFNTTTSMGRLTLNVLLSFAQFEREVIGERIRDKIAASKKKGMWMGGHPMLGYDIKDRQLVINAREAETVHFIYDRYLGLGSVASLADFLEQAGITSKVWISGTGKKHGGTPYGRGALHHLLSNPVYAGYVRHRGELHKGLHEAILTKEQWDHVQEQLIQKAPTERGAQKYTVSNILKGKLFNTEGVLYTPTRTRRQGRQYHYYTCRNRGGRTSSLPVYEIDNVVIEAVRTEIGDLDRLSNILDLGQLSNLQQLEAFSNGARQLDGFGDTIGRVVIDQGSLTLTLSVQALADQFKNQLNLVVPASDTKRFHTIRVPYHTKRACHGAMIIRSGERDPLDLPPKQLESLVRGIVWRDAYFAGKSLEAIAMENICSRSLVIKAINRSFEIA